MIKVIAFDYAQVVAEGPMSKWIKDNPDLDPYEISAYKDKSHLWDVGKMTPDEINQALSDITNIAPQLLWKQFYDNTSVNTEIIELIKQLKPNYKIVLFSNFIGERLRKLLDKFEITQLFDEIIISSECGLKKPDPKFYDLLVQKAGVEKEEIFFTDDSKVNVDAANLYGIKAYQFINYEQLVSDLQTEGVQ
jgi:epoxide hydrolase-like predicted phosphatase